MRQLLKDKIEPYRRQNTQHNTDDKAGPEEELDVGFAGLVVHELSALVAKQAAAYSFGAVTVKTALLPASMTPTVMIVLPF